MTEFSFKVHNGEEITKMLKLIRAFISDRPLTDDMGYPIEDLTLDMNFTIKKEGVQATILFERDDTPNAWNIQLGSYVSNIYVSRDDPYVITTKFDPFRVMISIMDRYTVYNLRDENTLRIDSIDN